MGAETWKRNLAAVTLAQMLSGIAFSFIFPFIPLYLRELGADSAAAAAQWTGLIAAGSAVSMTISQPIWGNLADRWGRKAMLLRSMFAATITVILMGLARSPQEMLVLRFIQGAFTGVSGASIALVATSTPKQRMGFALGIAQVAMFVGTSIGPLLGGLVADSVGYRATFFAGALFFFLGAVVVVAFVRENFVRPAATASRPSILRETRSLLAVGFFPTLIGVIFLIQFGGVIISPILSLFVEELSGGSYVATSAGVVFAAAGGVSALSAVFIGRLGDRMGHRVILPVCLLGSMLLYFPQAWVQTVWQLILLRMMLGVFLGGLSPSANALVTDLIPAERRGGAFGLTSMAGSMASGVGPLVGAGVATQWGLRAVFIATGALFALAFGWVAIVFRGLERPGPRPKESAG